MSPGGAIFFLPTHPKERPFLPLSWGNLWCILPLLGNSIRLPGKEVHGWWWSVRLRDFRGCCKPAVSGLGGYRPGLPEERVGGNPASRLSPATGCQSSTRFEGHVWRVPGPPKKGTQKEPESGWVEWSRVIRVPPVPFVLRVFPAASGEWKWGGPSEGSGWLALAPTTRASDFVTRWLKSRPWHRRKEVEKGSEKVYPRKGFWRGSRPADFNWHTRPWGWRP